MFKEKHLKSCVAQAKVSVQTLRCETPAEDGFILMSYLSIRENMMYKERNPPVVLRITCYKISRKDPDCPSPPTCEAMKGKAQHTAMNGVL